MGKLILPILLIMSMASCSLFQNNAVDRYTAKVWEATAATWATDTHVYGTNELLFCTDCGTIKRGDGIHRYSLLRSLGVDSTIINGKVNKTGDNISGRTNIIIGSDSYRLGIMKSAGVAQSGNGSLGAATNYLQIGGGEWNVGSYRMIGFGYVSPLTNHPPAQLGYVERSKSSNTLGDLVFATRNSTGNVAPSIAMRIDYTGQILAENPAYWPGSNGALTSKRYVDSTINKLLPKQAAYVDTATASVKDLVKALIDAGLMKAK